MTPDFESAGFENTADLELTGQALTQTNPTWGLDRIDQRKLPLDLSFSSAYDGTGVSIYVIGTGIRATHTEFGGRVMRGFSTAVDDDPEATSDCSGFGTRLAGVAASTTFGVAKNAKLVPVRAANCEGTGSERQLIEALNWVVDHHSKPAVALIGLIGGQTSSVLKATLHRLRDSGVTTVMIAGSENRDECASNIYGEHVITVGASNKIDARLPSSNFGPCVDLYAPGMSIASTGSASDTATSTWSGTSNAGGYAAGAVAILLSENPSLSPQQVRDELLARASKYAIQNSFGFGRLLYTGPDHAPPVPRHMTSEDSDAQGGVVNYPAVSVSPGSIVKATLTNLSGDADLYVGFDKSPTRTSYVCASDKAGTADEVCELTVPATARRAFFMVHGYANAPRYTFTANWAE